MNTSPRTRSVRLRLLAGTLAALSMLAVPSAVQAKAGISSDGKETYSWNKPLRTSGTIYFSDCDVRDKNNKGAVYGCGYWSISSIKLVYPHRKVATNGTVYVETTPAPLRVSGTSKGTASYSNLYGTICSNRNAQLTVTWTFSSSWLPPAGKSYPAAFDQTYYGLIGGGVACPAPK